MKILNLNNYKIQMKEQESFLNSLVVYNDEEVLVKKLLLSNMKENIPLGQYSSKEGLEIANNIIERLREYNKDFKLFYSIYEFDHMPEALEKKAGLYIVAEGMQNKDPFWQYSKHKNIVYWWLLSDGTLIAENESEKYGSSFVHRKFKQFEINGVVFDFLKLGD